MNRREGFKAMNIDVIVLQSRDLYNKLKLVSNEDWGKRFEFFWAVAWGKTQIRHDLSPLLSRNLRGLLLFVDDPFSVCLLELLVFPSHAALRFYMPFPILFRTPLAVFCLF